MDEKVVLIGVGEMGAVFARGFLRSGIAVYPVTRAIKLEQAAESLENPDLVLLAVAENDLHATLSAVPQQWQSKLALLQNELLPNDWTQHGLSDPTVISVWFEKKKGQDVKVLIPSPVFGPGAILIKKALSSLDIPVNVIETAAAMEHELVLKNLYILTTNIAGLQCGGTVESLWSEHKALAQQVAAEVMDIQERLTGKALDRDKLMQGFEVAIQGDLQHKCMGRSAPARLQRALKFADEVGLSVPTLREIASALG